MPSSLDVFCPTCRADRGKPCRTDGGKVCKAHKPRRAAARTKANGRNPTPHTSSSNLARVPFKPFKETKIPYARVVSGGLPTLGKGHR